MFLLSFVMATMIDTIKLKSINSSVVVMPTTPFRGQINRLPLCGTLYVYYTMSPYLCQAALDKLMIMWYIINRFNHLILEERSGYFFLLLVNEIVIHFRPLTITQQRSRYIACSAVLSIIIRMPYVPILSAVINRQPPIVQH